MSARSWLTSAALLCACAALAQAHTQSSDWQAPASPAHVQPATRDFGHLTEPLIVDKGPTDPEGAHVHCFPNPCVPIDYYLNTATGERRGTGTSPGRMAYRSDWLDTWWPNEFDLTRQKWLQISFTVQFAGAAPVVAVGYSSQDWGDPNNPPADDVYVVRIPVDPPITAPGYYEFTTLLPFCPLWVSVDVMSMGGDFTIEGTIVHVCLQGTTTGACCFLDVTPCSVITAPACAAMSGDWLGPNTVCEQCPPPLRGDTNCDGRVDFADIDPFVAAIVSRAGYEASYPHCRWQNADINLDTHVDFDDINPFVECLALGGCP